ncbi:MAG: hypothetical protein N3E49_08535 [Bacteroidia bacterium]|nr:hypothetical protein [Bacteroidia bacterium]
MGYLIGGIMALLYPTLFLKWLGRSQYGIVSYLAFFVSQSYLLNLGLGEALAQYLTAATSQGKLNEGIAAVRAALAGLWSINGAMIGIWLYRGVESLGNLLDLGQAELQLLSSVRFWVPGALWGIQTGMLLGWVPIALGRFRWAAFHSFLQSFWQAVFPVTVMLFSSTQTPTLALKSILLGYFGYGATIWILVWRTLGIIPLPGNIYLLKPLLKKGLWTGLQSLLSLPYTLLERTLVGRWVSLQFLGFYSATHFLSSKLTAVIIKGSESLFPTFGSVIDSPVRQQLRLSQATWFLCWSSGVLSLWGWAGLVLIAPLLPIQLGSAERFTLAAAMGSFLSFLPVIPLSTFHQSQGAFRLLFWINTIVMIFQLMITPIFVSLRLFFLPSLAGHLFWMTIYTVGLLSQKRSAQVFWRAWVIPTYGRVIMMWGISALAYISLPLYVRASLASLTTGAILFLNGWVFLITELMGARGLRKRTLLKQLIQTTIGLAQSSWRRLFRPKR